MKNKIGETHTENKLHHLKVISQNGLSWVRAVERANAGNNPLSLRDIPHRGKDTTGWCRHLGITGANEGENGHAKHN